jgi:hypothetical protein
MLFGIEMMMRGLGWEPDELWRRWTKRISTPQGPMEHVIVWASPVNVLSRWAYMANKVANPDPGNLDPMTVRLFKQFQMKMIISRLK